MEFTSTPLAYSNVNQDLVWVCYDANSTNPAYTNYKYVLELYIGTTRIYIGKAFPRPIGNFGVFNLAPVIREYINAHLSPSSNGILAQEMGVNDFLINVQVKIREEYNGSVGAVVLTDDVRTFYNFYNSSFSDLVTNGSFEYTFDFIFGYLNKIASLRPKLAYSFIGNKHLFIPYFALTNSAFNVVINGTHTKTITPTQAKSMQILNLSPDAINNDFAGAISSSATSYSVNINGQIYTINVVCEPLWDQYPVHFLNKFGAFETMIFSKVSRKSRSMTSKDFFQQPYRINDAGALTYQSNKVFHDQRTTFGKTIKEKLTISTDFLSDAEWLWLADLVSSPMVYVEINDSIYPVTITETNYDFKSNVVDGLNQLILNVDTGVTLKTQFQ